MGWVTGLSGVQKNIAALYAGERRAMIVAMREIASLLKTYAKANHEWQPRTQNTQNSTEAGIVKADIDEVVVSLHAGMDYDVFLELARDGKWAWLWPAILACKPQILEILVKRGCMTAAAMTASMAVGKRDAPTEAMSSTMAGNTTEIGGGG
jgi:hypothetical protein